MPKSTVFSFEYESIDEVFNSDGGVQYGNVVFTEDFGFFEKGEKVECLYISIDTGEMKEYDNDGEVTRKMSFKAVPCPIV